MNRNKHFVKANIIEVYKLITNNSINSLSDVNLDGKQNNDLLYYNSYNDTWEPHRNRFLQKSIKIGEYAGDLNQEESSIAIGYKAGSNNQCNYSISIGYESGMNNLGSNSISIGYKANQNGDFYKNTLTINASNYPLVVEGSNRTYINPIRIEEDIFNPVEITPMLYNNITKELVTSMNNSGYLKIINQNTGNIDPKNCCGRIIYSTSLGGVLTLPPAVEGMNIFHILGNYEDTGEITLLTSGNDKFYLSGKSIESSHTLNNQGSHLLIHFIICAESSPNGKWFIMD